MKKKVSQSQLILPLLDAIEERGGAAKARDVYDLVADRVNLSAEDRATRITISGHSYNAFEREVRWAQQRAKLQGLLRPAESGLWTLTDKGSSALTKATPGLVVTIFMTDKGAALWGHCEDAVGLLDDESISLIFSSPPYPLLRKKQYGNLDEREYLDWMVRLAETWMPKLAKDSSVVLNLGDAWRRGEPTLSLYQERLLIRFEDELGLNLCQRFAWQNSARLPNPAEWVTIRRVRVKPSLENIFWLSASDNPYADNRQILVPYSDSMKAMLKRGGQEAASRPAGYRMADGAFGNDNGGAIPGNLIVAANTESNSDYIRGVKAAGLPVHPARFPATLPETFIRFLTRPKDLVFEPFGGSLTTAAVAEALDRRWVASECMLEYIQGGQLRFPHAKAA
ncbi:site-specific DNA-methyltransferase [Microvirga arsenatis]|uniref:Methyltransferase n=1 Tax=Microvirga arsenatis TaxID=2692265 RepID=A0ABW9Z3T1_9HYPH|nr:site-specific DNA-methyltransferase [Microvirga arsenatis]NBJ13921.1 DNA methylase [Microvirga arsenatis]NBJ27368.1 DNA methylase [Microvirga arsenatis]